MEKETWESAYRTLKFQLDLSAEEETYLNDFVRILLASQKEKMLGVLEGMEIDDGLTGMELDIQKHPKVIYNQAIKDVKKLFLENNE